jgi:hypothetical protein
MYLCVRSVIKLTEVYLLCDPRYVTQCVSNLADEKSLCKYIWISHRRMNTGSMLTIEFSNLLMMTQRPTSLTDDDTVPFS